MKRRVDSVWLAIVLMFVWCAATAAQNEPHPAHNYRRAAGPVAAQADGTLVCEAEEFQPTSPAWQARPWGTNYYAATLANTFLSRKAYLSAPEQGEAAAAIQVVVPRPGRYLALVRYEAVYRFETQFRLVVEQQGQVKLNRLYGARANPKIWAFRKMLAPEVRWDWGAVENVVWEGHDAAAELAAGPATITLVVERQPEPAARRNVDLVLLTADVEQVQERIARENYLPLDGLLTQAGDVFARLHNEADGVPMKLTVLPCIEHSPYWVHERRWKAVELAAEPGRATEWVEVGSLLDSLNDGQWRLAAEPPERLHYGLEIGLRSAAGAIEPLRTFERRGPELELTFDADTRYSRRIRPAEEVLYDLLAYLNERPVEGPLPRRTPIFGYTFDRRKDDDRYNAARDEFLAMFGLSMASEPAGGDAANPRGYIDVRGQTPAQLAEFGKKLQAEGTADRIAVISLGDEIGLAAPPPGEQPGFHAWLKSQNLTPADVDTSAGGDWAKVACNPVAEIAAKNPRLFYYSNLYRHHYGIEQQKALTDALLPYFPHAGIGANFSPHHGHPYLGETAMWVTLFRRGGMTMPWSEDWIFQVPVGTQQMNTLGLDLFRAALRGRPQGKIQYYVMAHWPGNTPDSWRRQFYGDLGHGMKVVNLFEFRPVQAAYTENHCSLPEMYQQVREAFHELGRFDDIVADGRVRPGAAALWFSETGDIWNDNRDPFAAGKRTLYIAARHQQLPLDVVIDEDALAGDLKNYRLLYLADQHVSRAASRAIADWVAAGGQLFATAGAGMFDEFNEPNRTLRELTGLVPLALDEPPSAAVALEKQDLPWVEPLDTVEWRRATDAEKIVSLPIFSVCSRVQAVGGEVQGKFADGSPAVVVKKTGQGAATYCGFLPGLSYFRPAIPRRPVDRNSAADSMAHFIPTAFDAEDPHAHHFQERMVDLACGTTVGERSRDATSQVDLLVELAKRQEACVRGQLPRRRLDDDRLATKEIKVNLKRRLLNHYMPPCAAPGALVSTP